MPPQLFKTNQFISLAEWFNVSCGSSQNLMYNLHTKDGLHGMLTMSLHSELICTLTRTSLKLPLVFLLFITYFHLSEELPLELLVEQFSHRQCHPDSVVLSHTFHSLVVFLVMFALFCVVNGSCYSYMACTFSWDKSAIIQIWVSICSFHSSSRAALKILSLSFTFFMWYIEVDWLSLFLLATFGQCIYGELCNFQDLGNFLLLLLRMRKKPLAFSYFYWMLIATAFAFIMLFEVPGLLVLLWWTLQDIFKHNDFETTLSFSQSFWIMISFITSITFSTLLEYLSAQ